MEESAFGKLGRDGFTSILLQMRPVDVVKLCWLTNLELCDNVDWKTLLRVGFQLDDPEEIEDDPADQRMQFYNITCSKSRPLYVPVANGKFKTFKDHITGKILEKRQMPSKMKFLRFIDETEKFPTDLPETYYYPNTYVEELQRPVFPEGEKRWAVMLAGIPVITIVDTSTVSNGLRKIMKTLVWEYPQEDDHREWGRLIAINYCTEAVLENYDVSTSFNKHFKRYPRDERDAEIFSYIYVNDYYLDGDQLYQIGEVEFLPIWK